MDVNSINFVLLLSFFVLTCGCIRIKYSISVTIQTTPPLYCLDHTKLLFMSDIL